jgi:DNA-directed RNA polymerase specialized sigma24 family protein
MHEISPCAAARSVRRARRGGNHHHHASPRAAADTEALRRYAVMLARKLSRGQFDPEDLAHEVLERWLRCAPRLAPVVDPRAWVTVVLRRLLVDRLRRRRAAAEVPAEGMALAVVEPEPAPWWCAASSAGCHPRCARRSSCSASRPGATSRSPAS